MPEPVVRGDQQPIERHEWGTIQWLDGQAVTGTERLTVGLVTINPGAGNPEHHHPNCDEALLVLEGELEHTLGEELFRLAPGDLLHIPAGTRHRARNLGAVVCRVVVSYDSGRREVVWG